MEWPPTLPQLLQLGVCKYHPNGQGFELLLEVQKNCKNSAESLYMSLSQHMPI